MDKRDIETVSEWFFQAQKYKGYIILVLGAKGLVDTKAFLVLNSTHKMKQNHNKRGEL